MAEQDTGNPGEVVETPAAEATAAGSEDLIENEEQPEEQDEKKDGKYKRIATLSYRLRESQRREQELKEENLKLQEEMTRKPVIPDADVPNREDYEDETEYLRAVVRHDLKVELARYRNEENEKGRKLENEKEVLEAQKKFQEKIESGYDKYGERFEEAIVDVTYSDTMMRYVAKSDYTADIAMYLLDNPDEAKRMAAMSEPQLVRALTILEFNIKDATSEGSVQKTKAPKPPTEIKSTKSPTHTNDYSKMSGDEYRRIMEANRIAKAKAALGR